MDTIGKVDGCGTVRQVFHIARRCKAVNTLCKQVQVTFQKTHELPVIGHVPLPLQDLTKPAQFLFFLLGRRFYAVSRLFVFPVGCDTVLGGTVHLKCTDLDFKRLAIRTDQGRMKRLVHVLFRHRDVILETARNRLVHLMDDT